MGKSTKFISFICIRNLYKLLLVLLLLYLLTKKLIETYRGFFELGLKYFKWHSNAETNMLNDKVKKI